MNESQMTLMPPNKDDSIQLEHVAYLTKIADGFMHYVPPFILAFGTFGNLFVIIIMLQPKMRRKSSSMYLCVLAIADIIVLYTGLLRRWLVAFTQYDIRTASDVACKLFIYLLYVFSQFDSWILCALTIERLFAVTKPLKVKIICSRAKAATSLGILLFIFLVVNCHFIWMFGVESSDETNFEHKECYYMKPSYGVFYDEIYVWVDFLLVTVLPSSIIIIGNIILVTHIVHSRVQRQSLTASVFTRNSKHRVPYRLTNATIMLIAASVVFVVTTTPLLVMIIGQWNVFGRAPKTEYEGWVHILWQIVNLLYYSNNAFNFSLYCLSARSFRKELKLILCYCCRRINKKDRNTPLTQNSTNANHEADTSIQTVTDTVIANANAENLTVDDNQNMEDRDHTVHDDTAVTHAHYTTVGDARDKHVTNETPTDNVPDNDSIAPVRNNNINSSNNTDSVQTVFCNRDALGSNIDIIESNYDIIDSKYDTDVQGNFSFGSDVMITAGPYDDCIIPPPETYGNDDNNEMIENENVLTIDFDEESISSFKETPELDDDETPTGMAIINNESEETQL
ncbi:unnamed protein product [Owenia fusiformis]|uniref:G-protein coupled receptors family 1 profile domain-containing protein n=1 Tax=Owenia fusiformis TaxID=6347 RepID=A0A8S4Q5K5_OWEFU|nr:unnamed protein product [Owenia fusiformis]